MSLTFYLSVDDGGDGWFDIWEAGYTHNVTPMWRKAGVYDALYESHRQPAGQLIKALEEGAARMDADIEAYRALNPGNGWGDADSALGFLRRVLAVCKQYPRATVRISR